ncbi:MAG: hypothetical protein ACQEXJ_06720 [Myxococcota bacterium]
MKRRSPVVAPCLRSLCGLCVVLALLGLACERAAAAASRFLGPAGEVARPASVVSASSCADRVSVPQSRVRSTDVAFCLAAPILYGGRDAVLTTLVSSSERLHGGALRASTQPDVRMLWGRPSRTSALVRLVSSIPPRATFELEHDVVLTADKAQRGLGAVFGVHYTF